MRLLLKLAAIGLFLMPVTGYAVGDGSYTLTKSNNKVEWVAIGNPGFLRINGVGGAAEGKVTVSGGKASGTVKVGLAMFDTGIGLRNQHMKDKYLEVKKFPDAKLSFKNQAINEAKEIKVTGDLTLKGVTKPVQVLLTIDGKKLSAKMKVNIKDYPIGIPEYLGVTVADNVDVSVEGTL